MKKLLIICAIFSLLSCGSRKKALEKTSERTKIETVKEVDSVVKKDVTVIKEIAAVKITTDKEQETNFTGEISDPTTPATVEREVIGNKVVTTFKNFKNVNQSSKQSDKVKDSTVNSKLSEIDLSEIDLNKKEQAQEVTETKSKKLDIEVKRSFPWWWLILVAAFYLGISQWRKSFNPVNWL